MKPAQVRRAVSGGLLLALAAPFAAAATAERVAEVLPNGLRVSVVADPRMPVVATQVWYHVGAANEDSGSRGLAHLFEHLMFGATATRDARDYADYHDRHGGYDNAFTSPDETVYLSIIAPPHHVGVLEREADRMVELALTQENLDNEIRIVTEELRLSTENDPTDRIFNEATRALLGEHPYAIWPTGTKEDIAAATLRSCRDFYERFYGPANAHLVVAGPVDAAATLQTIRRLFGPIPRRGATPADVPALDLWRFPPLTVLREDLPPVEVAVVGYPLPPPGGEDHWAIAVMTQLLAGGAVDPLREEIVRRRGKAIDAGIETLLLRRGGALVFYSASLPYRRKATAFRLLDGARDELSRLAWLTEESLAGAKRALRRAEASRSFYAASVADSVGRSRWWLGDEEAAFEAGERIDAVTLDQVRRAYVRYVGEARAARLYVRPERVPLWIRLFGWLYPLVD